MEWPKVKNIIILILLLVNGFLLFLVGGQQHRVRHYEQSALTRAAQVLEQNGISVSEKALKQAASAAPPPLTVSRDLSREAQIAHSLLGSDAACTDQSGGLYVYSGKQGTAIFRANGDFTFTLSDVSPGGQDPADHAAALLEDMGLTGELIGQESSSGVTTVSFRQLLSDIPLFSCRLEFEYSSTRLRSISGTLLTADTSLSTAESASTLDVSTALIRFLAGILDSGDVCSAVTGFRPGYLSVQSFGSTGYLTPVWLVSTNISDYYLDGTTGELTRAS